MKSSINKNLELDIFREKIQNLLTNVEDEKIVSFAWRCAVRSLPFLVSAKKFKYYSEEDRQIHLKAIFYAIDIAFIAAISPKSEAIDAATNAYNAAKATKAKINDPVSIAAANAAKATSVFTARTTKNGIIFFATNAARAAAEACNDYNAFSQLTLEEVQTGKIISESRWLKLYEIIWGDFQKSMDICGCSYWAQWYNKVFNKDLVLNFEDVEEIKMRLKIPNAIKDQGAASMALYMEELKAQGEENLYEARIIIVGEPGAGKTTLFKKLKDEKTLVPDPNQKSTHGINIDGEFLFNHLNKDGVKIKTSIWDFGGQDIQSYLHQYFYSKDNLFILVCDYREENTKFDYWFEMITRICDESNIIVVRNQKGRESASLSFISNEYEKRFPGLTLKCIDIDLKETNNEWKTVVYNIEKKLSELRIVNDVVPRKWKPIRDKILQLKKQRKPYISLSTFHEICKKARLNDEGSQRLCLNYLHIMGYALHYDDIQLINYIFIDPYWITTGLYEVLKKDNYKLGYQGRFSKLDIHTIWKMEGYNEEEDRNSFLNLLLKDRFEVCYKVEGTENYLVPLLFSNERNEPLEPASQLYVYRFKFPFMPFGFFSRLIVRLYDKIWDNHVWLNGVWLKDKNDCIAKLEHFEKIIETGDQVIELSLYGKKIIRKELFSEIRRELYHIRSLLFSNLIIEEQIPCICEKCLKLELPYFHSYDDLKIMVDENQFYSQCKKSGKLISSGDLLDSIINTEELKRQFKEMGKEGISIDFKPCIEVKPDIKQVQTTQIKIDNKNEVTITINNMLGEVQNLKEDFEDEKKLILKGGINDDDFEVTLKDIGKAETAIKEIETAQQQNQPLQEKSKGRLKRFVDDLSDENSTLYKGLKLLRKGRDYGLRLAELYNNIAANAGMPSIPPIALEVIKKI